MIYIAPSILSADLSRLKEQIEIVEKCGADYIHIDVMDGHFVPNITFGPMMVETVKKLTRMPLDVHLMISEPEKYITQFVQAGADIITVHQEACIHLHRIIQQIKEHDIKAGVSLNPATPVDSIRYILADIDLVLIMSVNPGFGGQRFIEAVLPKIQQLVSYKKENNYIYLIEVDGGINPLTAAEVAKAGAEILVAGNAIFNQPDIKTAFNNIRDAAVNAR